MTKNISLRILYLTFVSFLWVGLWSPIQAQTLSVTSSVDSNCTLTISLYDSLNNITSLNPPYLFSVGGLNFNNNSLGSVSFNASSLTNGIHVIQVLDGSQNTYSNTINITCGKVANVATFVLIDSTFQTPSSCDSCDGAAYVEVSNPNSSAYTFNWSDGVTGIDSSRHQRTNLCPGIYTVVVTDTLSGLSNSISLNIGCTGATPPQVASCFQSLDVYLDNNGLATVFPQDLSNAPIDSTKTQAYIIDQFNNFSSSYQFNCQDLGYHYLTLLFIDSAQQIPDTCSVLIQVMDSTGTCNGSIGNTNGLHGNTADASSCNTCDGSYSFIWFVDSLTAIGPATAYLWSDGSTLSTRNDLCPNQNYMLSVSDGTGNIHTATVIVGCQGTGCIDSNSIDSSLLCPSVYAPVCGCDSVTYINACIAAYQYGVTSWTQGPCSSGNISLVVTTSPSASCDSISCTGTANINITGGVPPYTTTWSDTTILGTSPTNLCAGSYTFTVDDAAGNSVSSIIVIGIDGCVWPGDADDNTIANNFDLLPIGLYYGDTGPARAGTSSNWAPVTGPNWLASPALGLPNRKHIDCNGDGSIDSSDILPISQNYGQSYFRSASNSLIGPTPFFVQNTVGQPGDTLVAPIILGDVTDSLDNAYGVAFTINYNPDYIDASSVASSFNNSWLGNNLISISKNFDRTGRLEVALSRTDKTPAHGFGALGTVSFTIKDDVFIGRIVNTDTVLTSFTISNVRLITHYNTEVGTNPQTGTVSVSRPLSITKLSNNLDIRLYPNPTDGLLNIRSKQAKISTIRLFTATGQLIETIQSDDFYENSISTEQLAVGVYFLSIQTDRGVYNNRIQVIR
ncbi:T9SS type A sorting domain-containing protein [Aureispira anguillae]|nr:T9SS type A sorting domain-containing protein [Aureispira anguillae]